MMMGALVVVVVDSDSRMVPCECCCCDVVVDSSYYRISLSLANQTTSSHKVVCVCLLLHTGTTLPPLVVCVGDVVCTLTTMYSPYESTAPSHTFARCRPDSFRYGTATHVCCQRPVPTNRAKSSGVTEWVA